MERDGEDGGDPRPGRPRGARPRHLAGARRLALDGVRHGGPAQGRRRRGRRASRSATSRAGAATGSACSRSETGSRASSRRGRDGPGCSASCSSCAAKPRVEGGGATSLGEALGLVSRLARQRSLVIVASDFRGPRDWRPPLLRLAGGHDVLAIELRDPREETLPNVGELRLVDPETGPPPPRRHGQPPAPGAVRSRRRGRARGGRPGAALARRRSRRPLDGRRLVASARRLPAPARSGALSFATPLALLALLLVPLALGGYLLLERRRRAESGRVRESGSRPEPRRAQAGAVAPSRAGAGTRLRSR